MSKQLREETSSGGGGGPVEGDGGEGGDGLYCNHCVEGPGYTMTLLEALAWAKKQDR